MNSLWNSLLPSAHHQHNHTVTTLFSIPSCKLLLAFIFLCCTSVVYLIIPNNQSCYCKFRNVMSYQSIESCHLSKYKGEAYSNRSPRQTSQGLCPADGASSGRAAATGSAGSSSSAPAHPPASPPASCSCFPALQRRADQTPSLHTAPPTCARNIHRRETYIFKHISYSLLVAPVVLV